jgi:hypothetical protein
MTEDEHRAYSDIFEEKGTETSLIRFERVIEYLISIGICINEEWHEKGWVKYPSELKSKEATKSGLESANQNGGM